MAGQVFQEQPIPAPRAPTPARPRPRGRPRDRRLPARRREEILAIATGLFASHGYAGCDLQAIADRTGIAKGTLYLYFPSKQALFLAAADRGMRLLAAAIDDAFAGQDHPLVRLRRAIGTYLRFFRERPEFCELFILERAEFRSRRRHTYFRHRDANSARWRAFYAGLARGGLLRDIAPERVQRVMGDLVYGTMFTDFFAARDRHPDAQAHDLVDVIFRGILTHRGNELWSALNEGSAE